MNVRFSFSYENAALLWVDDQKVVFAQSLGSKSLMQRPSMGILRTFILFVDFESRTNPHLLPMTNKTK